MEEQNEVRAAVVGVGYYGSFHAEKYATLPGCKLVGVVDIDPEHGERAAAEYEVPWYRDHRELIGQVDVVSVAVPANAHFEVARDLLEAGIHVLVEKPVTGEVAKAETLVGLAEKNGVILKAGFLERFNPAFRALPADRRTPSYVESHRLTPFPKRNVDVSVVLDLMIHDIDLILTLNESPVERVQAKGVSVFSDALDLVNAVIQFKDGMVANLTASRASTSPQRTLHLFQHNAYTELDLHAKSVVLQYRHGPKDSAIEREDIHCDNEDILRAEVRSFVETVRSGRPSPVMAKEGLNALKAAQSILSVVEHDQAPMDPLAIFPGKGRRALRGSVMHDTHPETRETVFSRSSLVSDYTSFGKDS